MPESCGKIRVLRQTLKEKGEVMSLQNEYQALLVYCKNHGLIVKLVGNDKLHDYAAMNECAAKRIGFPIPKNEIWLDKTHGLSRRVHNLKHELIERNLMLEGQTYWQAHCNALRREHQKTERMR
jgi:hypothetical protein